MQARLLVMLALGAAALAPAAAAATTAPRTTPKPTLFIVAQGGYSIELPPDWYPIPRTTAQIKQEITKLKGQKNRSLAAAYSSILDSPLARKELSIYSFQAFLWPPLNSLIPTEVNVQVVPSSGTTKFHSNELAAYAASFARSLQGVKASGFAETKLLAGKAAFFKGTATGSPKAGLDFFFFAHDNKLYILSFELGDAYARTSQWDTEMRAIAGHFIFKT